MDLSEDSTIHLSADFTLEELTHTSSKCYNEPDGRCSTNLLYLCQFLLQPIRNKWGSVSVSSGYRSHAVNAEVGGAERSQHLMGQAADFTTSEASLDAVFHWIVKESCLAYGQCIRESKDGKNWIHISLPRLDKQNREALVIDARGRRPYV